VPVPFLLCFDCKSNPLRTLSLSIALSYNNAMKPFHAAGLAMIAWYLLIAPSTKGTMNVNAPVREWKHSESFDNVSDCEAARKQIVAVATAVGSKAAPGSVWAKCLSSDDPALKKN
jgi:hypothetical protein